MSVPIDTIVTAETPEGISIAIRPAGFAVRAVAFLIDALIRIAMLSVCGSLLSFAARFGVGIFLVSAFVLNWLYPVLFELSPAAATPGKRVMGLYVLMANGLPITPAGCLIRNLLRAVDMLPLLYGFGIVCVLLRRDARRLGDLAAGTVVAYRSEVGHAGKLCAGVPIPPPLPLSMPQQRALTAFAWRVDGLTPVTDRLVGIARWLHGDRTPESGRAAP